MSDALTPEQTRELRLRQVRRNRMLLWILLAFVALFFAVSMAKMGGA